MTDSTWIFIACCWIAWLVYWVVMAFTTKRTVERRGFMEYRVAGGVAFVVMAAAGRLLDVSPRSQVWQTTPVLEVVTCCMVAGGVAFTVWARVVLGRNWSAEVTFKQDHELIESGPYALVRHPIYTGLILMGLGTAVDYGRVIGFALVVTVCSALWWKVRMEEQVMSTHFPDAYADYRRRVRAVIPFVL
jgi:protein-S-isoprenylcysteine O-methyltransferase Ste14